MCFFNHKHSIDIPVCAGRVYLFTRLFSFLSFYFSLLPPNLLYKATVNIIVVSGPPPSSNFAPSSCWSLLHHITSSSHYCHMINLYFFLPVSTNYLLFVKEKDYHSLDYCSCEPAIKHLQKLFLLHKFNHSCV